MTSKQKLKSLSILKRKSVRVVLIIVGVALILFLGWFATRNDTLFTANKDEVGRQVQAVLNVANFQGVNVYNSVQDTGCDSGNSVGLARYVHCDLVGRRYFKGDGDLTASLREADKTLMAAGWQPSSADQHDRMLAGDLYSIGYQKGQDFVRLASYRSNGNKDDHDYEIQKLLDSGAIPQLKGNEFLYGVFNVASYWSVRCDSFFKVCPTPPSKPHF